MAIDSYNLFYGIGISDNKNSSKELCLKSVSKGNKLAKAFQNYFGFELERNFAKSYKIAKKLLKEESLLENKEDRSYCLNLCGIICNYGQEGNFETNIEKAIKYYSKAMELNNGDAFLNIGELYKEKCVYLDVDEENCIEKAKEYFEKAIELNHSQAMYEVACLSVFGAGEYEFETIKKGLVYYEKLVELNNSAAINDMVA
jgi:TPR repeat protein